MEQELNTHKCGFVKKCTNGRHTKVWVVYLAKFRGRQYQISCNL
jgi:hypothetical protein